ncbi:hypothetical protein PUNSTDRAFT_59311 [Punctularia strigosozonata HHB-11173 SS5]|uniref:uncharacterized protein n=1 Tax=Punctularia strigosozonata (strain HHB-11173) TaxID=741275 RepID=UPI00044185DF|nr:uncharacterized protein PUNSTDRAFT_59311 [Punctularia strigosozonata HHB-11173 SS5]EIN13982.1 hypothetical protein PUNSTDRAFT_59311 [Punctularia strigosozonata HHB-11173 SS5]
MSHSAAINNDRNSEEGKEHARHKLEELEKSGDIEKTQESYEDNNGGKDEMRVNAGYKATMKNPNVSDEAKEHARELLEKKGAI